MHRHNHASKWVGRHEGAKMRKRMCRVEEKQFDLEIDGYPHIFVIPVVVKLNISPRELWKQAYAYLFSIAEMILAIVYV